MDATEQMSLAMTWMPGEERKVPWTEEEVFMRMQAARAQMECVKAAIAQCGSTRYIDNAMRELVEAFQSLKGEHSLFHRRRLTEGIAYNTSEDDTEEKVTRKQKKEQKRHLRAV